MRLSGNVGSAGIAPRLDEMTLQNPPSFFDHSSEAQRRRVKHRGGSRAMLSDKYFRDMVNAWEEQGQAALNRMAFHDPSGFCNMVARLMPQKIEHSTPTDGMTDERLAQLLDIAERAVEARQPLMIDVTPTHQAIHENEPLSRCAEEGGGGPERSGDAARGGSASTSRDASEENEPIPHEDLNNVKTPEPQSSVYDDRTPVTPYSLNNDIPHPVGRPFPKADHDVSRSNRAALAETDEEDDIDPQSLF